MQWVGNDIIRNAVFFVVDNSSTIHADNGENRFFVLTEGPIDVINNSAGIAETKFSNNFYLSPHYSRNENSLYMNKTGILKFKAHGKKMAQKHRNFFSFYLQHFYINFMNYSLLIVYSTGRGRRSETYSKLTSGRDIKSK